MGPFNFNPNNPIFQRFGGFNNFQAQFANFANQFRNGPNVDFQQMVQQKLDSGQMTQEQFEALRQQVNQMTGMNR